MSIFQSIVVAQKYEFGTPIRTAIDRSYRESQMILGIVATAMCVPNLFIMWFIKNVPLEKDDTKEEEEQDAPLGTEAIKA
jgi:hypothetical protein